MPVEPGECRARTSYALLAYCFIFCVIPLTLRKNDPFVQFHVRQGLALCLCEMAVFLASIVLPSLMKPALFIFAAVSLWGMVHVLRRQTPALPFISSLSQKFDI